MIDKIPSINDFTRIIGNLHSGKLMNIIFFMATWLIGGNILIIIHYRRLGEPWYSGFKPFAFPLKYFNLKKWIILALLAITSLSFLIIGSGI